MEIAKLRGARMVKKLVVSGAFHSALMASSQAGLKEGLDRTTFRDARIPVYANVTAEPVRRAGEIRSLLYMQVTSPVRWEESVNNMVRDGMTACTEIGPGRSCRASSGESRRRCDDGGDAWRDFAGAHSAFRPEPAGGGGGRDHAG